MICCCSLAGTVACRNCPNRHESNEENFIYPYERIRNIPQEKKISLNDLFKEAYPMKAEIYCKNCGSPIMIYHNFCSNCGEKNEQHYNDGGIME